MIKIMLMHRDRAIITGHHIITLLCSLCSGLSSVLNIIVNRSLGFHDRIAVTSLSEFFHSNAWMGALTSVSGAIGGQVMGLIADK